MMIPFSTLDTVSEHLRTFYRYPLVILEDLLPYRSFLRVGIAD
jgi:hypothetical protein